MSTHPEGRASISTYPGGRASRQVGRVGREDGWGGQGCRQGAGRHGGRRVGREGREDGWGAGMQAGGRKTWREAEGGGYRQGGPILCYAYGLYKCSDFPHDTQSCT